MADTNGFAGNSGFAGNQDDANKAYFDMPERRKLGENFGDAQASPLGGSILGGSNLGGSGLGGSGLGGSPLGGSGSGLGGSVLGGSVAGSSTSMSGFAIGGSATGISAQDSRVDAAFNTIGKPTVSKEKGMAEESESPSGPVGLDVGTSNIAMAQNKGSNIHMTKQLNAFFTIPKSKFTKQILEKNAIKFLDYRGRYYIIGYAAENFANLFNTNTKRTMQRGLLSPREDEGITLVQAIIGTLIQKPKKFGEVLCFSIPGQPYSSMLAVSGHENIIKMYLESLGYTPVSVNEGLAVVMSELSEYNFTGIGISMGGGMCNVCLAYMSVPVITFSIQKGGDYIDEMVSHEVGEPETKVKVIKEESFNLSVLPKNRVELSIHMHYMSLINELVQSLQQVISSSDRVPKISQPIPIVISGGTSLPSGLKTMFEKVVKSVRLPIEISTVIRAEDPLNTTAKGALIMAMAETR
jgi:hypothetical protein